MVSPLLTTKLYIPPTKSNLVARLRLLERLEKGLRLGHKLFVISTPAGFGKTMLLSASPRTTTLVRACNNTAQGYVERLREIGAQINIAATGLPTDNPYAERDRRLGGNLIVLDVISEAGQHFSCLSFPLVNEQVHHSRAPRPDAQAKGDQCDSI